MTRWNLQPLLAPRSIAIVGASESPDSWAPEIERSLRHFGFDGELYPINPKYDTVWERPCLSSIAELPRGVDLVVFVVPARVVVRMIDDCGARGVRGIMVVSSGFAEAGEEGRALQAQLRDAALRNKIPVLGPNVEGFVNYVDQVAPYGTTPPATPTKGGISVISQSGTVAWTMNQMASDRAVGLRIILGVGNEAVLGLGDLFAWAAADAKTTVVTSYIETMRDVDGIGAGLDALRAARKPVLICAPEGKSEAALRSIIAHTGALAGNTGLRDAWLRGHGVVLVEDPVTMFEAAVLLSHTKRLRTDGVAAALQSGGACTLFAEAAGAADLPLPEYSRATKTALKRALPSYASQNNPLDVTGQAAVETDMFVDALSALASDPSVGLVAFDAFPPRMPGETPWADPVLSKAIELQRSTGVAFVSLCMSPLAYTEEAQAFTKRWKQLPFLQGHRASVNAIRALLEFQGVRQRAVPVLPPHANRGKALRVLRGASGPVDEATGAALLGLYGVRRPKEGVVATPAQAAAAAAKIRGPVAIKAVAPEIPHKARLGGVRLGLRGTGEVEAAAADVLAAAKRGGARVPKVLVQEMVHGHEVLVGAIVDEQFGATITIRPGGALAEAGEATFVAAPLTAKQARAYVASQAERCGLNADEHDLGAVAKAVESIARATHDLRDRITSLEANPLLVGPRSAIAVDALAEAEAPRVIYGLFAALGWGLADFFAHLAGRRLGSLMAVLIGQVLAVVAITAIFLFSGYGLSSLDGWWWLVAINGIVAMSAYALHYHALELGPVSVVSPIGAGYAVVGVLLSIVVLGERPSVLAMIGIGCSIVGAVLVSTDIKAMRAGLRQHPPGLWWAVASAIGFGVAGFTLGVVSQKTGLWQVATFASRWAMVLAFVPLAVARGGEFSRLRTATLLGVSFALIAGATDVLGVASYSAGTEAGSLSIVLAASAVFPLIAVWLSHMTLHERLATNQYVGIGFVVLGLLMLGLGS